MKVDRKDIRKRGKRLEGGESKEIKKAERRQV